MAEQRTQSSPLSPGGPQQTPSYPVSFQPIEFSGFTGLDTKPTRPGLEDQSCFWLENFIPLGARNLRCLYDIGAAIFVVAVTTWNPNDKASSVALTGGNLVATFNSTVAGVRATTSKSSGDYYFEATPTNSLSGGGAIGVGNSAATLAGQLGSDANGYGVTPNGNVWYNGHVIAVVAPYALGSVVGIAVAAFAQLMWVRTGLLPWNNILSANPSTLTGGISVSGISDYWPMATGSEH